MAKYKIEIDRDLCIGDGACVGEAPNTIQLDGDNIAIVTDPEAHTPEEVMQAAQVCPVDAIRLYDETGKQIWPQQ